MFDLYKIIRPHLRTLRPYVSARHEYTGETAVLLDANENPYDGLWKGDGRATMKTCNRYPDPLQTQLKSALGRLNNVNSGNIFLGNGSDEIIDLLVRLCCEPGKNNIIINPPAYGMYETAAAINNVEVKNVNLTPEFQLDTDRILDAVNRDTRMIFVCRPNNPTGNGMKKKDILFLLNNFDGLVVVDEAYIDFSSYPGLEQELGRYPNLVILRTFSKAWGMAGLRLGMSFASPEITRVLNMIKSPYNISGITQNAVLEAIGNPERKTQAVQNILSERKCLSDKLSSLGIVERVFSSEANFLLVRFKDSRKALAGLRRDGIIVRDRSGEVHCERCLRITVGTPDQNVKLIQTLMQLK